MSTGYIKLYRKIDDSIVWTNSDMLKLWLMCLTKATHTDRKFLFNGKELQLQAGQFVTGRKSLTDDFNKGVKPKDKANERTLWRYIKQLEKEEMLSIDSNAQYSVVSIVNWCSYQQSDQQLSNDCPTPVHQVSTNKNDKNDKNDKKKEPRKRIYEEASQEYLLADKLYHKILSYGVKVKEPDLQDWSDTFRLMIERDKISEDKISDMIDWVSEHKFWKTNVLSPTKLRKQYPTLKLQANEDYLKNKGRSKKTIDDYFDESNDSSGIDNLLDV